MPSGHAIYGGNNWFWILNITAQFCFRFLNTLTFCFCSLYFYSISWDEINICGAGQFLCIWELQITRWDFDIWLPLSCSFNFGVKLPVYFKGFLLQWQINKIGFLNKLIIKKKVGVISGETGREKKLYVKKFIYGVTNFNNLGN